MERPTDPPGDSLTLSEPLNPVDRNVPPKDIEEPRKAESGLNGNRAHKNRFAATPAASAIAWSCLLRQRQVVANGNPGGTTDFLVLCFPT